jgi:cystathionine beta-lyase
MDLKFDFDQRIDRRNSGAYKWDDNEKLFGRADLLPFWVADMDIATPQPILDAIRERTNHPVIGYETRSDEYFSAVQDWLRLRHQWDVPREWLMFCPPSSIVGIQGVVECLSAYGDSIVAPTPTYGPLIDVVEQNGRKLIRNPLRENDGRFELNVDDLESRLDSQTRLVMLCSPNNPVGRVFSEDELSALADVAERNDLVVISDEVHCDLVLSGYQHIPYGKIGGERSVTVISPNKTFNSAGIPQATLVIPDEGIRQKFQRFLNRLQLNHDSTFGALGMIAAYRHCGPWLDELISYLDENHHMVANFLENVPGVKKVPAEATYLAWFDFREAGLDQDEIMDRLVNIGGVGLYSGLDFGEEGVGFMRMNLACPRSLLLQGLEGIAKAVT